MRDMNRALLLLTSLCCLLLASCSLMEQRLQSQSGLYDVELSHTYKVAVDGYWTWGKGSSCYHQPTGCLYIAPLDVSAVQKEYPELAPVLVEEMHGLMKTNMEKMLAESNAANRTLWRLTENEAEADIRIDLAVVSLKTQKPLLHIAAKVLGYVAPTGVGDAVELVARGDITLEGTIRDARKGELIMAFKDSNRAKLRFYHKDAYRRGGNADANLRLWAEKLAILCRECAPDRMEGQTLQDKVEQRTLGEVIRERAEDAL